MELDGSVWRELGSSKDTKRFDGRGSAGSIIIGATACQRGVIRFTTHGAGRKGQELVESWWAPTMVMGALAMSLVAGAKCTMMEFWPQE